jgi:NAD(P)-dependent dehydrogenase (short-subunit alcohol dehydrogenase family)
MGEDIIMQRVLVTGSNRGLGLEWVRQYAAAGWRVYATCRFPELADDLHRLAGECPDVTVHHLDVTHANEIHGLAVALAGEPLDLLVNNAAIYLERWGKDTLGQISYDHWQETFNVNTLGAMRVSEALIDNLARSEQGLIVAISSHMGSIRELSAPNDYAYRSSKAALNAAMKGLALEVAKSGVGVLLLHPGWVRTRMGGEDAPVLAADSVAGMRELIARYQPAQSGHFFNYEGHAIPW